MLDRIFLQIFSMSFTASFVILFVLVARLFLRKLPKVFSYALWGIVATVIVIIIIGIGLTTNPINSVRLPEADDINLPDKMLDRVIHGTQIAGDRFRFVAEAL